MFSRLLSSESNESSPVEYEGDGAGGRDNEDGDPEPGMLIDRECSEDPDKDTPS